MPDNDPTRDVLCENDLLPLTKLLPVKVRDQDPVLEVVALVVDDAVIGNVSLWLLVGVVVATAESEGVTESEEGCDLLEVELPVFVTDNELDWENVNETDNVGLESKVEVFVRG